MPCASCVRCPSAPIAAPAHLPPFLLPEGKRWPWQQAGSAAAGRQAVVQGISVTRVPELNEGQVQPK